MKVSVIVKEKKVTQNSFLIGEVYSAPDSDDFYLISSQGFALRLKDFAIIDLKDLPFLGWKKWDSELTLKRKM